MKYIIFTLLILIISCSSVDVSSKENSRSIDSSITSEWKKYLDNIEKMVAVTKDKRTLLQLKEKMTALYLEGIENYDDFDNDLSIKISKISQNIDNKIKRKIAYKNKSFQIVDIIAQEIIDNPFIGSVDDGESKYFSEKDLKSSYAWPLKKIYITSPYGFRKDPISNQNVRFHHGIDFAGKIGTSIFSANHGKVIFARENHHGYGLMIIIKHRNNILTVYAHLSKILVKSGQYIKKGEIIGLVGSTGRSTGPHLHFEVRRNNQSVDPMLFIHSKTNINKK